jgi:malonyl-CoA O-methyltransferase
MGLDEFFLDPRQVRRSFDRASRSYDRAAAVHAELRARLLERLDVVRIEPKTILDLGAGTAHASRALKQRYSSAHVIAIDASQGMLRAAARQQGLLRRFFTRVTADAAALPLPAGSVDLIFSNLMLQWCADPDAVFAESRRVLRAQGLLMFTTLGPDTLCELREAWRTADPHTHVHRFIDMHDLGDALVRAGFVEPVMDTERLTVTYPDVDALMRELKASGSHNLAHGRARGLSGRSKIQRLRERFAELQGQRPLSLTVEAVYGHAWVQQQRTRKASSSAEIFVPLASLTSRTRTDDQKK